MDDLSRLESMRNTPGGGGAPDGGDLSLSRAATMRNAPDGVLARIDQYELVRELGGGGFGTVYLARDTVSGVEYAVKGLPPEVKNSLEELEGIRANFRLVSRLPHSHIARAYALHPAREVWYAEESVRQKLRVSPGETLLVMEYAPGVTLSKWRRQFPGGRVPLPQALEIARQVASALDYAHEQKIIHRDIKPSNVMVETKKDGMPAARVLDFGLAAEIRSSMGRVSREVRDTSGTRPYMAPEQWLGAKQGAAADQYALAVLFHELVTGEVPFASVFETGDVELMKSTVATQPFAEPPGLPKPVRRALSKALAKKPGDRFASCGAFAAALAGRVKVGGAKAALAAVFLAVLAAGVLLRQPRSPESDMERTATPLPESRPAPATPLPESRPAPATRAGAVKTVTLPGGVEMRFRWCPAGTFEMGSPESEEGRNDDERQHRVTLAKGFWMAETEVTQGQWKGVMGGNPSAFKGDDRPVERVSWDDCQEFIEKVNARLAGERLRLPTEAEWEYACRAGTGGAYGGTGNLDEMGWYDGNSGGETHPVKQKRPNAWGLYDMHGNVWEWCADWYGEYPSGSATDPTRPASGTSRVLRGGSWSDWASGCRSAIRGGVNPGNRYGLIGFRLVCSAASQFAGSAEEAKVEKRRLAELEERKAKEAAEAAKRTREPGAVKTVTLPGGVEMRFRWCPAGTFTMGSPPTEEGRFDDERQHEVTLTKGFWMGQTEVTQGQWKKIMDGETVVDLARKGLQDDTLYDLPGGKKTLREFWGMSRDGDPMDRCGDLKDDVPVYNVSWNEAVEFCRRLTQRERAEGRIPDGYEYRLPTEAEWEYACRAGTTSALPNGRDIRILGERNAPALDDIAWYGGNSSVGFNGNGWKTDSWPEKQYPGGNAAPREVKGKLPNRWGLYDMIGNVWEWCGDRYGDYPYGSATDPTGAATGAARVVRGGGWGNGARGCRSASRGGGEPGYRNDYLGFRVALAPSH